MAAVSAHLERDSTGIFAGKDGAAKFGVIGVTWDIVGRSWKRPVALDNKFWGTNSWTVWR
jgi:hypothetical protein